MKIFIYHNSLKRKKYLEEYINAYCKKQGYTYHIFSFCEKEEAIQWLGNNAKSIDVLFLDCTKQDTAVQMIKIVRPENLQASWIYVDGDLEGLCETLLWRPSVYLRNSAEGKEIISAIRKVDQFHRLLQKKQDFKFKFEGEYVHIPYRNISYFESSIKNVILHLRDGSQTYYFRAKLDDIQKMMPDSFLRCHQSYLVNMEEIRRLDSKEHILVLNNNEDIPVSRRQYTTAKEHYEQFLNGK